MDINEEVIEKMLKNDKSKTLSVDVVKRMMDDAMWLDFRRKYFASTYRRGSINRAENLSKEVTSEEKEILKAYLQETDIPLKELTERFNIGSGQLNSTVRSVALRLLYNNSQILER